MLWACKRIAFVVSFDIYDKAIQAILQGVFMCLFFKVFCNLLNIRMLWCIAKIGYLSNGYKGKQNNGQERVRVLTFTPYYNVVYESCTWMVFR